MIHRNRASSQRQTRQPLSAPKSSASRVNRSSGLETKVQQCDQAVNTDVSCPLPQVEALASELKAKTEALHKVTEEKSALDLTLSKLDETLRRLLPPKPSSDLPPPLTLEEFRKLKLKYETTLVSDALLPATLCSVQYLPDRDGMLVG